MKRYLAVALVSICTIHLAHGASDGCDKKSGDLSHGSWTQRLNFKSTDRRFKQNFNPNEDFEVTQHIPMRIGDFEIPLLSVPLPQDLTTFRYSFSDRALYHANPAYNGTFKIECTDTSPSKVTAISPTTKSSMANGNMSCLGYLQNMRKQLDEYRNKFKSHSATDEDTLKCAEKRLENAILQVKKLAKERGFVDEQKGEDNHADNTPRP